MAAAHSDLEQRPLPRAAAGGHGQAPRHAAERDPAAGRAAVRVEHRAAGCVYYMRAALKICVGGVNVGVGVGVWCWFFY